MSPPEIPVGRWKRLEYERLVEGGFLGPGDPIELLGGQLIVEPDLAVVPGSFRDYRAEHPSRPVLVVEVAESSLLLDREHKGSLYARARIADQALEIYREPARDASAVFGWRYGPRLVPERDSSVSPLAPSTARVCVADLLL